MIKNAISKIHRKFNTYIIEKEMSRQNKIFCIGLNKTGTTSMTKVFKYYDIPVGSQRKAEHLTLKVLNGNNNEFIKYIKYGGVAFQDVPFSIPNTYQILDEKFPNSKFILTLRDSPEIWYNSLLNFHTKKFGNGKIPDKANLMKAEYVFRGWIWETTRLYYNTPESDIYNKDILIQLYEDYNTSVINYFKEYPEKLPVVNLKDKDANSRISKFLEKEKILDEIPWENKTNKM